MRQGAGMTQLELAAALGVPQVTLSAWETGRYRPAAGVLARWPRSSVERYWQPGDCEGHDHG